MGLLAEAFRPLALLRQPSGGASITTWQAGTAGLPNSSFATFAREGYGKNETVFAAIELRATSAAEPRIIGRRKGKNGGQPIEVYDHPILTLLNKPNPYMSRAGLWSTIIMDRDLAGNAYLLKARGDRGNNVQELWRLRPDRVQVVPVDKRDPTQGIAGYLYRDGAAGAEIAANDIIHFKTRHPLDDWYGMPPLMALSGRVDIDNYMKDFVKSFFQNAGVPSGVLSVKSKLSQDAKDQLRTRFRSQFGGPAGWHELLVIDQNETTYTPLTMSLGQRGLVIPELSAINEAHIAMVFGVPASILGVLVGLESSSYANKRADWQVFWDIWMAPLFREFSDVLNMALLPDFSGLDEVLFDLSDVRALQEDIDALQDRWRKDLLAGAMTIEEYRVKTGNTPLPDEGTFLIPGNYVAVPVERLGAEPEPLLAPVVPPEPPANLLPASTLPLIEGPRDRIAEARCPDCNALLGRGVAMGEPLYCRKCKMTHPAGGPIAPKVLQRTTRRVARDADGYITEVSEEVIDASDA